MSTSQKLGLIALLVLTCAGMSWAQFRPATEKASTEKVVGWRGDGTGRYPNATPPTEWHLKENGESKNILWKTKLPCYSWATPVVVGDKVFTRSEPYDLICLDKNSGKLLWIRSHPPFIAVTDDEKKANPAWKEIGQLVDDLHKVNDEFVKQGWTKELYKQKYDLQHKINDLTAKADKKYTLPKDMYVESWAGYTGATPCSDGKFVYISSGDGITACYDLDGNRTWAKYESVAAGWGEHGSACSPTVAGDKLLVATTKFLALNKATGAELFTFAGGGDRNDGYAFYPITVGQTDCVLAFGCIYRLSDGKLLYPGALCNMMTYHDNMVFVMRGGGIQFWKMEPKGSDAVQVSLTIQEEYNSLGFPIDDPAKRWEPMFNFYTASPLYHDGLVYCLSNWGKLVVIDTQKVKQKDCLVYAKNLPFDFKNPQSRKSFGMGIGASPALAGKYIYMIDSANCVLVMEPGREYKQIAKNNIDYTVPEGWEPGHWMGAHHEQTEGSLAFDGSRIYIRGEQFLYCVGEK